MRVSMIVLSLWLGATELAIAADIGVGADNSVWVVTNEGVGEEGNRLFRWGPPWLQVFENAVRVDVGPKGIPWIVDRTGGLFRAKNSSPGGPADWEAMHTDVWDVGIGADGSVWILVKEAPPSQTSGGMTLTEDDFKIYEWGGGTTWSAVAGGGHAIDVEPGGTPWVVTGSGDLYRYDGSTKNTWTKILSANAVDIGIGGQSKNSGTPSFIKADGTVMRCAFDASWSCTQSLAKATATFAGHGDLRISVGVEQGTSSGDVPFVVVDELDNAYVYHHFKEGWDWENRPYSLSQVVD